MRKFIFSLLAVLATTFFVAARTTWEKNEICSEEIQTCSEQNFSDTEGFRPLPPDTIDSIIAHDAAFDSIAAFLRDSMRSTKAAEQPTRLNVPYYEYPADSLRPDTTQTDTIPTRKPGIDAVVEYTASDSMIYEAESGLAFLYGKGNVKYTDMTLDAYKITMNMDSSLVHAEAGVDTAGVLFEQPVYKQGGDEYVSERMSFNFKTKRGFIQNVNTSQGEGFLQSTHSKRNQDGTFFLEKATYTTCDAEHPHFHLALSRAKVRPGKEAFFGPAQLYIMDVPTPLVIPYGFFPFSKKYASGLVMPTYGDEMLRGFYLRDGGYYFAISDRMDLKLLGEIYTKGSWGLSGEMNYNKRYHFRGNVYVSYINTVEGEKNMPDYSKTTSIKVQWTHSKTAAAASNTSFSARVNFASQNYEKKNLNSLYNPVAYTQSTRASAISFSHTFPRIGFTISGSANLTQNMRDSTLAVGLPELSFSLARFYPFRRKKTVGKERWYEKISVSYTGSFSNSITTKENQLLHSNLIKDWRNGMQHRVPIDATFQLFKHINISPNLSFRDVMYAKRVMRTWDPQALREVADTTYGFYNLYDWNVGVSANTTLYGMYKPWKKLFKKGRVIAIRHVMKPSVSLSYAPDFTSKRYGYTKTYQKFDPTTGEVQEVKYSPYAGALYGYPSSTQQGLITMSLSNNVEMKVKSDRDSTGEKKISLIDELSGTLSYNLAAKERPWSNLSTRIRLKLTPRYTFSLAAIFATYAYKFNETGQVVLSDRTEWSYGRFGRFQGMSQSLSYTLNNEKVKKFFEWLGGKRKKSGGHSEQDSFLDDTEADAEDANIDPMLKNSQRGGGKQKVKANVDEDGYLAFSIPWSFTISYGVTMAEDRAKEINIRRMRYPYSFTQNLNFSGYIRIAEGWNITFTSGYDFRQKQISMTTASLSRDLHCFEMSCSVVLHPYTSYNFSFRCRSGELRDVLKWDKRSSYSTNIDWY